MEVLTRILAAAALTLAAGCSFLRDPTPVESMGEQPSVHALLVTGSDTVKLLLQMVGPGVRGQEPVRARPLTAAEVSLSVGGQSVRLAEAPAGFAGCAAQSVGTAVPATPGCYAAVLPGGVRPGAVYDLSIRLAGGGTIEGKATALTALRLESPTAGARIHVTSRGFSSFEEATRVPLRLGGAERAPGAAVDFLPQIVYSRGQALTEFYCSVEYPRTAVYTRPSTGDLDFRLYGLSCVPRTPAGTQPDPQFRVDSVRAVLRVVAFDSAYTRYTNLQEEEAIALRDARSGVTGALGLFAAAARTETEVMLIPQN
jgi:hypothetical protein